MEWILLILAVLISVVITYLVLRPRIIATQELDAKTIQENAEIRSENIKLLAESDSLQSINLTLFQQNERLQQNNESATNHLNDLNDSITRKYSKEPFIKHFQGDYLPIWVLVEIMSFGNISMMYANLIDSNKDLVCKSYLNINKIYLKNYL